MVLRHRIWFALLVFVLVSTVCVAQEEEKRDVSNSRVLSFRELSRDSVAMTVQTGPGRQVKGLRYDTPPLPPGVSLAEEEEEEVQLPTPILDDETFIPSPQEIETDPSSITDPSAPGSAIVYRNSVLSPVGNRSNVAEPSVGSQGDGLFTTHNWYAAVSTNNGSSFSYVSPYTTFPNSPTDFSAGFCCDQRVAQSPSRDLIFWYLQYRKTGNLATSTNGVRLAVTHGQAGLANNAWAYYDFTPSMFGLTGKWFDFPHLQTSANYLYFTTNIFQTIGDAFYGALIVRIPLSQLDAGTSLTFDSFLTTNYGSIMAVSGAEAEGTRPNRSTMYFASVYSTTSIRVIKWPEGSSIPTEFSIGGLATTSLSTYACMGPDSLDPCTRANPRMQTGWITDTELGLMWTSSQNGSSRPYPYTRVLILDPSTLAVISQPDIWSSQYAWLYPAVSVNERSHLGGTIDALGGTLFPTIRAIIRDDLSPNVVTSGWETINVSASNSGTAGRWGDYNGAMTHEKYPTTWLGGGHVQIGGSLDANSQPRNFWFMRERDAPHWSLTVTKAGTGTGTVTSSPTGIDCGLDCTESILEGTAVTLTAIADAGSEFSGWGGACSGTGSCTVTMNQAQAVMATFSATTSNTLTVSKAGTGTGTVTSSPAGINCGTDCSEPYAYNTSVTLSATPATGSIFSGWSGACTGTSTCTVLMTQAQSVNATFSVTTYTLTVAKAGTGAGTVTSSPAGISCGTDCSEPYAYNTSVTLTATPAAGSTFSGWSGACTGTSTCTVLMTQAQSVTATFSAMTYTLTVSKAGTGAGTVTSSPAGINCGTNCTQSYSYNTSVTLTAAPAAGSTFSGWSGACTGASTCTVLMTQARSVTATFSATTYTLTVSKAGTGAGTVTSSPAGINCGTNCTQSYSYNTSVTLTAAPAAGSTFNGWSGACTGTSTCTVLMTQARSATATFSVTTYTLTVSKGGTGAGTVASSPAGISCGTDCTQSYSYNTTVTLTATPATGSTFSGWSGACTGTGSCSVTMNQTRSVTATFTVATPPPVPAYLTITRGYCYSDNFASWGASAGATYYELYGSSSSTYSTQYLIYSGSFLSSDVSVASVTYLRVRACNASGCSAYRNGDITAIYYKFCA